MPRVTGTPDDWAREIAVCPQCLSAFPRDKRAKRRFCSPRCRLWAQIEVRGRDDCWPWTGRFNATGYGVQERADGSRLAHRQAYESGHGEKVPPGMFVAHACGERACCNPAHLLVATKAQINALTIAAGRDCHSKGTIARAGRRFVAVPSEPEVRLRLGWRLRILTWLHLHNRGDRK